MQRSRIELRKIQITQNEILSPPRMGQDAELITGDPGLKAVEKEIKINRLK